MGYHYVGKSVKNASIPSAYYWQCILLLLDGKKELFLGIHIGWKLLFNIFSDILIILHQLADFSLALWHNKDLRSHLLSSLWELSSGRVLKGSLLNFD